MYVPVSAQWNAKMPAEENQTTDAAFFGDETDLVAYNRVWFNAMRVHRKLHPQISKALKTCGLNDPIWYEILLEVDNAGGDGHLMTELEEKLFVPQYALSRHVSRLEKEGFLRRGHIADGRRKQVLFITEKGHDAHSKAWPVYRDAMQEVVGPYMNTEDAYKLSRLLIKLLP